LKTAFALLLFGLLAAIFINLWRYPSRQIVVPVPPGLSIDMEQAAVRLSQALRFPTVSHQDSSKFDPVPFEALRAYLVEAFPEVHRNLEREVINGSLLYKWVGSNASLSPALLMAHLDVVPGDEGVPWTRGAFSGDIADGFIWGRGALDVKGSMMAILEASEQLLKTGQRPRRTVYFAFGHDEEVGGLSGNGAIAARFKAQGVQLHTVLDEGSVVTVNILPNVKRPVALIGVAEKGYLTLELSVEGEGGHASMPAPVTNTEILAGAITKVAGMRNDGMLTSSVRNQLTWLAPELPMMRRIVLSNLWLFEPLVKHQMSRKASSDAMLRTTIAPTMLQGSDKENVLPHRVSASINFRLLQGTSIAQVVSSVQKMVGDERVKVTIKGPVSIEPSPPASVNGEAFETLHRSIREAFPDAIVVPSLVLGATDSRYYQDIARSVYRFIPVRLEEKDIARIHGRDERIAIAHYAESINFYFRYLIRQ
jgi:carboxypeptidase PM20D1